jgi:hypothetical protein
MRKMQTLRKLPMAAPKMKAKISKKIMKNTFLVIPGLTRNPVFSMFSWIPACEGMTTGVIFIGLTSRRQDGSG